DAEIEKNTLRMSVVINAVNLLFIISSRHIFQPRGRVLAYCYFFYCRDFTLCKSVFPLRLPWGGAVLHKVKTLQK
ncbi:hypothetical protein CIK99_09790, partial [Prevotella sp. P5-92]